MFIETTFAGNTKAGQPHTRCKHSTLTVDVRSAHTPPHQLDSIFSTHPYAHLGFFNIPQMVTINDHYFKSFNLSLLSD